MRRKAKPLCANFAALASRSLVITCVVGHLVAVPTFSSAPKLNHQHQHHHYRRLQHDDQHHHRHNCHNAHHHHVNHRSLVCSSYTLSPLHQNSIININITITVKTIITTIIITLIPGHLVAAPPSSSAPVPHQ